MWLCAWRSETALHTIELSHIKVNGPPTAVSKQRRREQHKHARNTSSICLDIPHPSHSVSEHHVIYRRPRCCVWYTGHRDDGHIHADRRGGQHTLHYRTNNPVTSSWSWFKLFVKEPFEVPTSSNDAVDGLQNYSFSLNFFTLCHVTAINIIAFYKNFYWSASSSRCIAVEWKECF